MRNPAHMYTFWILFLESQRTFSCLVLYYKDALLFLCVSKLSKPDRFYVLESLVHPKNWFMNCTQVSSILMNQVLFYHFMYSHQIGKLIRPFTFKIRFSGSVIFEGCLQIWNQFNFQRILFLNFVSTQWKESVWSDQ